MGGGHKEGRQQGRNQENFAHFSVNSVAETCEKKNHFGVANFKTWCLAQSRCLGFQNSGHVSGPYGQGSF